MRKKILIIDDDAEFAECTRVVLESGDYVVTVACDTAAGMKKLEMIEPDLIVLDVMMENRAAGFIFARTIRKNPAYNHIPILMATSMREQTGFSFPGDDPKHPVLLPVDEFMEKPLLPKELLAKVCELLRKAEEKG